MKNNRTIKESMDSGGGRSARDIVAALHASFSDMVINQCPTRIKMKIQKIQEGVNADDTRLTDREHGPILATVVSKVNLI
jgi:hypothetical protein